MAYVLLLLLNRMGAVHWVWLPIVAMCSVFEPYWIVVHQWTFERRYTGLGHVTYKYNSVLYVLEAAPWNKAVLSSFVLPCSFDWSHMYEW